MFSGRKERGREREREKVKQGGSEEKWRYWHSQRQKEWVNNYARKKYFVPGAPTILNCKGSLARTHPLLALHYPLTHGLRFLLSPSPPWAHWYYKYLGVTVICNLSWWTHTQNVTSTTNRSLVFIRNDFTFSPYDIKERLHIALISLKIKYDSSIRDSHFLFYQMCSKGYRTEPHI